jgi:predicted transcriptional regulator
VSLRPDQISILEAINNGINDEDQIAKSLELSIDIIEYYLQNLIEEGYVDSSTFDGMSLTSKGKVTITNPDRLIPLNRAAINQTTIHSNTIGFVQSANGAVSNFTQHIGQNLEGINNLISSLREIAQQFPQDERESVLVHLDDLEDDLSQPGKQKPQRVKARIAALLAVALSIGGGIAQTADFTNNVFELADKLGVSIEVDH